VTSTQLDAIESVDLVDLDAARHRLVGRVVRTPVLTSPQLDELAGARLWLKAENLQDGGSFKLRGALVAAERLQRSGSVGLVAQSTGNHAIAVAMAAQRLGLPAVTVLPRDVPPAKANRIIATGAAVVLAGTDLAERVQVAESIAADRGYDLVHPYENPDVIAGQASAVAELLDHMQEAGARAAAVVVPVGGGSLLAGACVAARGRGGVAVVGAEPAAVDSMTQAMRAGHPVSVPARPTIADGLRPNRVGALPLRIAHGAGAWMDTVGEAEIAHALCLTLVLTTQLVEPAAATAVASALRLAQREPSLRGRDIGVLLSGGNVEPSLVARLLARYGAAESAGA
jgi:threonine dehydratase